MGSGRNVRKASVEVYASVTDTFVIPARVFHEDAIPDRYIISDDAEVVRRKACEIVINRFSGTFHVLSNLTVSLNSPIDSFRSRS